MDTSQAAWPSSADEAAKKFLTVRQAAFIGVGAMVGAGIFALLGAARAVAGASIGSAVALVIFTLITAAHLRIRSETGASLPILILAIAAAAAVFVTFVFTTLIHEPASIVTLAGILLLSVAWITGGNEPATRAVRRRSRSGTKSVRCTDDYRYR